MPHQPTREKIVVGVDTHKHVHVAVALNDQGVRLGAVTVAADPGGYAELLGWARALGEPERFGIEGCGSYGQGLVRFLRRQDFDVVEAGRPDRRDRRQRGRATRSTPRTRPARCSPARRRRRRRPRAARAR